MTIELSDIAKGIQLAIDVQKFKDYPRPYLGLSTLGHSCDRYLWMYFRWAMMLEHDAKKQRLFDRGNLEEPRITKYLESIGIEILSTQETLVLCKGHLRGHTDGRLANVPGLEGFEVTGEYKTMAQKYFKPLVKKGLYKAQPKYWWQAINYMHHSGTEYCLHITVNKNTEELYIEIIKPNPDEAEKHQNRAERAIFSQIPPPRVSNDPTFWECNWCEFFEVCHLDDNFLKSCRTCTMSEPVEDYKWRCNHTKSCRKKMEPEEQKVICDFYDMLKV